MMRLFRLTGPPRLAVAIKSMEQELRRITLRVRGEREREREKGGGVEGRTSGRDAVWNQLTNWNPRRISFFRAPFLITGVASMTL